MINSTVIACKHIHGLLFQIHKRQWSSWDMFILKQTFTFEKCAMNSGILIKVNSVISLQNELVRKKGEIFLLDMNSVYTAFIHEKSLKMMLPLLYTSKEEYSSKLFFKSVETWHKSISSFPPQIIRILSILRAWRSHSNSSEKRTFYNRVEGKITFIQAQWNSIPKAAFSSLYLLTLPVMLAVPRDGSSLC